MISVHLRYEVDPARLDDFRDYAERWIALVERFGGHHHGYFLPSEGDSDEAFAIFSFDSLASYERYRLESANDPDCIDAYRFGQATGCIRRYERRFLEPVFSAEADAGSSRTK